MVKCKDPETWSGLSRVTPHTYYQFCPIRNSHGGSPMASLWSTQPFWRDTNGSDKTCRTC